MRRLLAANPVALAGWWFLVAAMLPVGICALVALPSAVLAPSWRHLTFLAAVLGIPLVAALGMGCVLGAVIAGNPGLSVLSSFVRGAIIALVALVLVAGVVFVDVETTDYSMAVESSRERSLLLARGLLLSIAAPILAFGGLAGYLLRWYARRMSVPSEGDQGSRRTVSLV